MLRFPILPTLFILTLSACGASRTPVPLVGASTDISALTGEWAGDYSSAESGRSGSISFTLRAAGDSAFGDVVMIPKAWGRALVPWAQPNAAGGNQAPTATVLTIRFVRVERGHVNASGLSTRGPQWASQTPGALTVRARDTAVHDSARRRCCRGYCPR